MRETIKLCSIVIGILSAIIGGGVAISGYLGDLEKRLDDRKKQTFQLINLFYSDGPVRARTAVLQNEKEIACQPDGPFLTGESRVNVFTYVEFFDAVETCIETGLCDGQSARAFFAAYANWHWPLLERHIGAIRKSEAGFSLERPYGYGLEKLAGRPASIAYNCSKS